MNMKKFVSALLVMMMALCLCFSGVAEEIVGTVDSRGVEVPATLVLPEGVDINGEYPLVVLAHGHGGSREENVGFKAIADALAAKGIASIRVDFPGCGDSTESFQENCMTNMKEDVLNAIQLPGTVTKLGLFGYSMGGRIVLELVNEGTTPDAIALLAPAADTEDLKNLFGGAEKFAEMKAEAEANGFVTFTTIYGQVQELSAKWFEDLEKYPNLIEDAASKYQGPALVIWGTDDEAVNPAVSAAVADALNAKTVEATGEGHGYGFYSEDDTVRNLVANAVADFFAEEFAK